MILNHKFISLKKDIELLGYLVLHEWMLAVIFQVSCYFLLVAEIIGVYLDIIFSRYYFNTCNFCNDVTSLLSGIGNVYLFSPWSVF